MLRLGDSTAIHFEMSWKKPPARTDLNRDSPARSWKLSIIYSICGFQKKSDCQYPSIMSFVRDWLSACTNLTRRLSLGAM